jgi:hypothetical protein
MELALKRRRQALACLVSGSGLQHTLACSLRAFGGNSAFQESPECAPPEAQAGLMVEN